MKEGNVYLSKFNTQALEILKDRYLQRDAKGNTTETPTQMLRRVAKCVAQGDKQKEKQYYAIMENLEFLPNSPTLMNAGRKGKHQQLSACFVLDVEDSMEGIFETLKKQALIHKTGGGTGFNFSKLRPKGTIVNSTNGRASGPVSFMELFDVTTEKVQQGGMRRGANMGILNVDHTDIMEFIKSKTQEGKLTNFNISIGMTNEFMSNREEHKEVWDCIIDNAWKTGDPGLVFLDTIEAGNTTKHLGKLDTTNPCGESPLYANEACNLGSINVSKFYDGVMFEWHRLSAVVHTAVDFLDDVIDVNSYPLPEIEEAVKKTRKIGLGIMGFADLLIQMGMHYDSEQARAFAKSLMEFIQKVAHTKSKELAITKGQCEALKHYRNSTLTCIAPTGTISLLAGCSSGIEPNYAFTHTRTYTTNKGTKETLTYVHPLYETITADKYDTRYNALVTAHGVSVEGHIKMQAVFQKYVDLAVSKTINLPNHATKQDVEQAYVLAWELGCKGVTIYRDGCKNIQVLTKLCDECQGVLLPHDGCYVCTACGWSPCS